MRATTNSNKKNYFLIHLKAINHPQHILNFRKIIFALFIFCSSEFSQIILGKIPSEDSFIMLSLGDEHSVRGRGEGKSHFKSNKKM